ncbi:hypothetical protein L596_021379 [Steinernema carpocapsae]|uniref:Uncharacterized protein n=1 Tax=Steinernema carpocapsae TaxID=34508 RepID=A0A4V5ZZX1_STECR|nr:hypothetical protein L596_021379 [Steinernema carpocapsae]
MNLTAEERRERRKARILANAEQRLKTICTEDNGEMRAAPCFEGPVAPTPTEDLMYDEFGYVPASVRPAPQVPEYEVQRVFSFSALFLSSSFVISLFAGICLAFASLHNPMLNVFLWWGLIQVVLSTIRMCLKKKSAVMSQAEIFKTMLLSGVDQNLVKFMDISVEFIRSVFSETTTFLTSFVASNEVVKILFAN